jgi:hypothetical protein
MYPTIFRRAFSLGAPLLLVILLFQAAGAQTGESPSQPLQVAQDHEVLLPYVVRVIAPPAPGLVNGDFEAGKLGWTEFSQRGYELILMTADLLVDPHSGTWAVWLGGDHDEISSLTQVFTVPSTAAYLSYYHWIASDDVCSGNFDTAQVTVNGVVVESYTLCDDASTEGWVLRQVNVTSYAGQQVTLTFTVTTDSSLNSNLFIDDVSLDTSSLQPASPVSGATQATDPAAEK